MATFFENLEQIATATYGREVRQSIVEALEQCYVQNISVDFRTTNGYLWGDVNGSGAVDRDDLTILGQYVNGSISTLPVPEAADINKDGTVSHDEAVYILAGVDKIVRGGYRDGFIGRYTIERGDGSQEYSCTVNRLVEGATEL